VTSSCITYANFSDRASAEQAIVVSIREQLLGAIEARKQATFGVCGGKTAKAIFPILTSMKIDWKKIHILLIDDRWVDPSADQSNEALIRQELLSGFATPAAFTPLKTAHSCPSDALATLERRLAPFPFPLDSVFVSMGTDGHIASLFPGGRENLEDDATVVATTAIEEPIERISLSPRVLAAARHGTIAVLGEQKRQVFNQARKSGDPMKYPVCHMLQPHGNPREIFFSP